VTILEITVIVHELTRFVACETPHKNEHISYQTVVDDVVTHMKCSITFYQNSAGAGFPYQTPDTQAPDKTRQGLLFQPQAIQSNWGTLSHVTDGIVTGVLLVAKARGKWSTFPG